MSSRSGEIGSPFVKELLGRFDNILEFENLDDYGRSDFNITMLLNSVLLYEFEDEDIFKGEKVYYKDKFYVEIVDMINDVHLFEYGNVIYGRGVDEILNNGILVK